MLDKSCYTCHYHSIVEGKLACTYNGICHTPQGEKTAYRPMRGSLEELEMAVMPFKLAVMRQELEMLSRDWSDVYGDICKDLPKPKGPQIITTCNPTHNSWLDSFRESWKSKESNPET